MFTCRFHFNAANPYRWLVPVLLLIATLPARAFSPHLDGTMMPYDFAVSDTSVPWGNDMKPVLINYVARHGARFLSSEKKISSLLRTLRDAESAGHLTSKGKDFLNLLYTVDSVTAGNWGALDAIGIMEEEELGRQMAATCPELLKKGDVTAVSSYVPRVVMTMYELCHELARYSNHLEITTAEGRQFDPLLRYFTTDKEYSDYIEHGPWRFAYENYLRNTVPVQPAAGMIKGAIDSDRLRDITLDAYGVLQSLNAAGIVADPSEWFTEDDYRSCWQVTNLKHYYQRSVSVFSDIAARSASPILKDIIAKTDSKLENKDNTVAYLRFGHAETVIPLFALMRLPGCYAPSCSPEDVSFQWNDSDISPLGANLMVVTLEDEGGKHYAAMRLNGKWIETDGKKIIEWESLKKIWQSYLLANP